MTVTESVDLFSFDTRRHRVVEWPAPGTRTKCEPGTCRCTVSDSSEGLCDTIMALTPYFRPSLATRSTAVLAKCRPVSRRGM